MRRIIFDTGLKEDQIEKILQKFSLEGKILYIDEWIAIKNFAKHQKDNPKVKKGIEIALKLVPKDILSKINIVYRSLSHSNSNSNLNSNSNTNSKNIATKVAGKPKKPKPPAKPKNPLDDKTPFTFEEFLTSMRASPQRHIQIIAEYADEVKPKYTTKGQWHAFVQRNVRDARALSPYSPEQIEEAFAKLKENMKNERNQKGYITKWTLKTLEKYLD